jgi:hypothetical protein
MNANEKLGGLGGTTVDLSQLEQLRNKLALPSGLADIVIVMPLIGIKLWLSKELDMSGLGAGIQWMSPAQMLDEAAQAYPGIVAVPRGYFPVGICLEGSGDPYFYRGTDGAIVRIPHDAASVNSLNESAVEVVAESVEALVVRADLEQAAPGG